MSVGIKLIGSLQELTGNQEIKVDGTSIGECMNAFVARFPDSEKLVFGDNNKLKIFIIVNTEAAPTQDIGRQVSDNDTLTLLQLFTGG